MEHAGQWIIGALLILSSIGVITVRKPVHASLCFLVTLLSLAALYLELSAGFISAMQILVYAGAILVMFMFVIVLFQDAHEQIDEAEPQSNREFLIFAGATVILGFAILSYLVFPGLVHRAGLPEGYGTVQALGHFLYVDFFFPFEAVVLLFLISMVGVVYIGRKV